MTDPIAMLPPLAQRALDQAREIPGRAILHPGARERKALRATLQALFQDTPEDLAEVLTTASMPTNNQKMMVQEFALFLMEPAVEFDEKLARWRVWSRLRGDKEATQGGPSSGHQAIGTVQFGVATYALAVGAVKMAEALAAQLSDTDLEEEIASRPEMMLRFSLSNPDVELIWRRWLGQLDLMSLGNGSRLIAKMSLQLRSGVSLPLAAIRQCLTPDQQSRFTGAALIRGQLDLALTLWTPEQEQLPLTPAQWGLGPQDGNLDWELLAQGILERKFPEAFVHAIVMQAETPEQVAPLQAWLTSQQRQRDLHQRPATSVRLRRRS